MNGLLLFLVSVVGLHLAELAVDEDFKQDCLDIHNYYRNLHQVGNVTWSARMESFATNWTQYLADNNLFRHDSRRTGNLYMARFTPKRICTTAIKAMYTEEPYYNYSNPGYQGRAGHFTQIVWKNTKYIGADWRYRKDGRLVLSIKYDPMGNWASKRAFRKNVFPPIYPKTNPPTAITTTAVTATANSTNNSTSVPTTNISATAEPTAWWNPATIMAGSARATAPVLVLAGSLVILLGKNLVYEF